MICEKDYRDKTVTDATHGADDSPSLHGTDPSGHSHTRTHTLSVAGTGGVRND